MSYLLIALLFSARPVDPIAADTLNVAFQRSAIVREMIEILERSHVVVHVEASPLLPSGLAGMTRFVTSRGGYQYIRITIASYLPPRERAVILGHELQHACELAESGADNKDAVRRLYERNGVRLGEFFDTRAALEIERRVRIEIDQARTLQTEPVVKFDH